MDNERGGMEWREKVMEGGKEVEYRLERGRHKSRNMKGKGGKKQNMNLIKYRYIHYNYDVSNMMGYRIL